MYHTLIFQPLYNGLVGVMDLLPWADVGVAVIIFTVIVKLALFHLSKSSILTQIRMKEIEPEANKIKAEYANDRQAQALKIMELYRSKGVKPFSGILLLLIQLPILLALLSVFYKIIPAIHPEYLYSFIDLPVVKTQFLGLIDLTQPSLILAILTAVAQYVQLHFSLASKQIKSAVPATKGATPSAPDFATTMNKQMKFMLPILAFASTYWIIPASFPQAASIIALYWIVSTLFTLGQELVIRKQYATKKASL
ncbi:MAG: YidC/Oxa1 family membrane protein insertase [Candidatus Paceibacterota bacterium]|jgi:YidC/Oxa1 family membrane protein insertase